MENKTDWYRKLLRKLNNIKEGRLDLDEYIEEVKSKIEAENKALRMSGVVESAITSSKPLKQCMAGRDGECDHSKCPVTDEDAKNGIFCHLPLIDWRE